MKKGILCFIEKDGQVLLGKFDYGNGNIVWNGFSGFVEVEEKPEDTVLREIKEEIGIEINKESLKHKGIHKVSNELELEIFLANNWIGVPNPREESILELRWFSKNSLPFDEMFSGNKDWLPKFLE